MIARAFADALQTSVVGDRTRIDAIDEIVRGILVGWDGKQPVLAQPLYDQLERIHGPDVAAAAALDLKAIAEKHAILVELPKHLKTLRLQERQELSARYHVRAQPTAEAPAPAPIEAPADEQPETPAKKKRALGVPAMAAGALLGVYLIARLFLFEDAAATTGASWAELTLPVDPRGLACAQVRAAGPIVECTLTRPAFDALSKADLAARASVTRDAVRAAGRARLRVRTDDGVVRGVH